MSDQRREDCPERVVLDLAQIIASAETGGARDRNYWLDLMLDCRQAVMHGSKRQAK